MKDFASHIRLVFISFIREISAGKESFEFSRKEISSGYRYHPSANFSSGAQEKIRLFDIAALFYVWGAVDDGRTDEHRLLLPSTTKI